MRKTVVVAAGCCALLAGCSILDPDPRQEQRDELRKARAQWAKQRPAEYSYRLERLCFCPYEAIGPVEIRVRGDSVLARMYVADSSSVAPLYTQHFGTMEDLFEVLESALDREADHMETQFDRALGYLITAVIDYRLNAIDEELSLRVSGFTSH